MLKAVVLACLLAGCGRLGFGFEDRPGTVDATTDAVFDTVTDAGSDAVTLPIQRWQQSTVLNNVGPGTLTLPAPSMAKSLLVVTLAANDLSTLVLPNGWTTAASTGSNGACFGIIAYLPNNPGGITTVSYTMSAGAPNVAQLIEIANASPSAPLDVVGQIAASSPVTSQSVSTSAATATQPELAVSLFCEDVNMPTYTPATGPWMRIGTFTNGSSSPSYEADFTIVNTASVVSETVTSDVAGKYTGLIATFR